MQILRKQLELVMELLEEPVVNLKPVVTGTLETEVKLRSFGKICFIFM